MEIDQPYGTPERDVMCVMVCGKLVDIDLHGRRYDGLVGLIRPAART